MKHGKIKSSVSQEGEFQLGYIYRTIEEQINAFAAEDGCPYSVYEIAIRVGDALRAKAAQIWEEHGHPELVSKMRKDGAANGKGTKAERAAALAKNIYVDSRSGGALKRKRHLSKKSLLAISKAQKKRWAKFHAKKANRKIGKSEAAKKGDEVYRKNVGKATKNYWATHFPTPEARKAEGQRRRDLAMQNKKRSVA